MITHFSQLNAHRAYILGIYRYTLRNVNFLPVSCFTKTQVKQIVRAELRKYRASPSSWLIYSNIKDLQNLNKLLVANETSKVWDLLNKRLFRKVSERINLLDIPKPHKIDKLNARVRNSFLKYIQGQQKSHLLPSNIPQKYLYTLLKPLAEHAKYERKLNMIESELESPPKTYLNYTLVGNNKLWFVRSILNRKHRQSKRLDCTIRRYRVFLQKNLDAWHSCEHDLTWAWHEAVWENYLQSQKIPQGNANKIVHKICTKSNSSSSAKTNSNASSNPIVLEWLTPFKESFDYLTSQNNSISEVVKSNKNLLLEGQYQHFHSLSLKVYERRLARFQQMKRKHLATVNPFCPLNNLYSILKTYKLINPKNHS